MNYAVYCLHVPLHTRVPVILLYFKDAWSRFGRDLKYCKKKKFVYIDTKRLRNEGLFVFRIQTGSTCGMWRQLCTFLLSFPGITAQTALTAIAS